MTNPKDVLESLAWKHEPAQRGGHYRPAETTGAKTANPDCGSAADDLGLCVEALSQGGQDSAPGSAVAPDSATAEGWEPKIANRCYRTKENKHPMNSRVSDLEDALYRARHQLLSARQNAAEMRETLTAVVAQAATELAALTQLEHDLEQAHDWLDVGEESE